MFTSRIWRCINILLNNNPHGGDIYSNNVDFDFSANVSPLGTPIEVINSIKNSAEKILPYPDAFCTELRQEISQKYSLNNDEIIIGNGAAELIFSFTLATKPKHALIVSPTFCEYENALKSVDSNVDYFRLYEGNDFMLTDDLLLAITNETDIVFVCNPNNPTGKFYNISIIESIANKCKETKTLLFIDECFFDLSGKSSEKSAINLLDNTNIFILKAFTKSYGMAGVRLGYLLTKNREILYKMTTCSQSWNVSTIAQNAGIAALRQCDYHIEKTVKLIEEEREFLQKELGNLGLKFYTSDVNFILFKYKEDLYEKMLKKRVLIRKCSNFIGLDSSFYRIAVKNRSDNQAFVKALKEVISNG